MDDKDFDRLVDRLAARLADRRPAIESRLLSIPATAAYLDRSVSAIQHMIKRHKLPIVKIDGKVQIDRKALERLIADNLEDVA